MSNLLIHAQEISKTLEPAYDSGSLFRAPRPCSNPQLVALITPLLQEHQEESWEPQTPDSLGSCLFFLVKTSFHSSLGWPPSAGNPVYSLKAV